VTVYEWMFQTPYPLILLGVLGLGIALGDLLAYLERRNNMGYEFEYLPIDAVKRIRITHEDYGSEGYCYVIDGTDYSGLIHTEEVWDYFDGKRITDYSDAIGAAKAFADEYNLPRRMVEPPSSVHYPIH
jgi:hypothetical protein